MNYFNSQALYLFFYFFLLQQFSFAQEKTITAGFQFKPIFSSKFLKTGPVEITNNNVAFKIAPQSGYCIGMIIRQNLTKGISFETGINYTKRNFNLTINDTGFVRKSNFSIIGYEIPLEALVFIRLNKNMYMDAAGGISLDVFPTNIYTFDTYFKNKGFKQSWILPGLLANVGFEYRTLKNGYLYIGASFHRPFLSIYNQELEYIKNNSTISSIENKLSGNYLTIDFRYFFQESPLKKNKKISTNDN